MNLQSFHVSSGPGPKGQYPYSLRWFSEMDVPTEPGCCACGRDDNVGKDVVLLALNCQSLREPQDTRLDSRVLDNKML